MKLLPLLSTLAGGTILVGAAGAAEAQCFDCVQHDSGIPDQPSLYCTSGDEYRSCTTVSNYDPNTCLNYTTCNNIYSCSSAQDGETNCTNSTCEPNQSWGNFSQYRDVEYYMCYHFGTFCFLAE
jgi:hypothetical protein